jgi:O-antigen/teichoic acid export membrane protein
MVKSGFWLLLSQAIVLLSIPYLARSYSVEEFSSFALFSAFFVVSSVICNLRLVDAIVIELNEKLSFLIMTIYFFALIFGFVVSFFYSIFSGVFDELSFFLLYAAILCITQVQIGNFLDVKSGYYGRASMWLALVNIFTIVFQIVLSDSLNGLVYGQVSALLLVAFILFVLNFKYIKFINLGTVANTVKRNKSFAIYLTLYSLVGGLKSKFVYFTLGSNQYSGVLSQAERISNAPNTLISGIIRPVVYSSFDSKKIKESGESVLGGLFFLIIILSTPVLLVLNKYSEDVVLFLLGEQWVNYHKIFFYVAVSNVIMLLTNWMDRVFDLLKKQKFILIIELIFLPIYVFLIFYFYTYHGAEASIISYLILNALVSVTWFFTIYYICDFGVKAFIYRVRNIFLYAIFVLFIIKVPSLMIQGILLYLFYLFAYVMSIVITLRTLKLRFWLKKYL